MAGTSAAGRRASQPAAGLVSSLVVLGSLMVLTAKEWRGWHAGLLLWGLAMTIGLVLYALGSERLVLRMVPEASIEAKSRLRSRQRFNAVNLVILGLGASVLAAGSGWIAVDVAFAVLFVVVGTLSTLGGIQAVRRRRASGAA